MPLVPPKEAGNGLLSRYHDSPPPRRDGQGLHGDNGLLARARRLGENLRATVMGPRMPRAGDWKASDFSPDELEVWDHHDAAPFDLPPDPDAPEQARSHAQRLRRIRVHADQTVIEAHTRALAMDGAASTTTWDGTTTRTTSDGNRERGIPVGPPQCNPVSNTLVVAMTSRIVASGRQGVERTTTTSALAHSRPSR